MTEKIAEVSRRTNKNGPTVAFTSPLFAKSCFEGKAPVLVTNRVNGNSTIDLIFELDDLTIRRGDVSRESDKHLAGYSLLNSNARARVLLAIS